MNPSKVLLVEDDEELGQAYVTRLEAEGFEVAWTKNGEEALAETVRFKPDLLLLDIMMPRISGFDVLDILKNTPETRDTKIIVLSALSSPGDIEKARMLGANDFLVKAQVTAADVVESIRHHLGVAGPQSQPGGTVQPETPTLPSTNGSPNTPPASVDSPPAAPGGQIPPSQPAA